jgi:hypothetical protein
MKIATLPLLFEEIYQSPSTITSNESDIEVELEKNLSNKIFQDTMTLRTKLGATSTLY